MKGGRPISDKKVTYGPDKATASIGDKMNIYSVGDKKRIEGKVDQFFMVKNNVVAARAIGEVKKNGTTIKRQLWRFLGRRV